MAPVVCECFSTFNLLITLTFDCSESACFLDTYSGTHLTLCPDSRGYVAAHHSKCAVFVLPLFACTTYGISFVSSLPPMSVVII